ncbi:MAG: hypothetical protein Q4F67_16230, partial [Propionibacteriaceae bacterium]|nr:hypothetical protein [Propionibacteriaceae bacterium]
AEATPETDAQLRGTKHDVWGRRLATDMTVPAPSYALLLGGLAFSPFGILLGQNYGGEAVFRVYLYSLGGAAILTGLLADHILPTWGQRSEGRPATPRLFIVATVVIGLLGAQASMGTWTVQEVTPQGVDRMRTLIETVPAGSAIVLAAPGLPAPMTARYAEFAHAGRESDPSLATRPNFHELTFETPDDLDQLTEFLGPQNRRFFLAFSDEGRNYARFYGFMEPAHFDRLHELIDASPDWDKHTGYPDGIDVYEWVAAPQW